MKVGKCVGDKLKDKVEDFEMYVVFIDLYENAENFMHSLIRNGFQNIITIRWNSPK